MNIFLSLELLKMKRKKFLLPIILFFLVGTIWFVAITLMGINAKEDNKNILSIINNAMTVDSLIMPLIIGTMCSMLFDIEHNGKTFRLLNISGQSIWQLFTAKRLMTLIIVFNLCIIQLALIVYMCVTNNIPLGLINIFKFICSYLISSLVLIDIHLSISLFIKKQSIGVTVALAGSFLALITGGMLPKIIQLFIPWQYYLFLNPTSVNISNDTFVFSQNNYYILSFIFVTFIYVSIIFLEKAKIRKGEFI
uniref:LmgE-immunity to the lacticin LMG ABC transporter (Membrane domain) n=1 Tax=Lactococcus lactis subsp. lactis TaxID=1360 RepID=A0A0M7BGH9_LACLL|nr:LmgE-immunity to the lacticin LMG; ABC transporter (membrane domain) [Lactococcus lactis subsp. lactis]